MHSDSYPEPQIPAIGLLEMSSIARGVIACDAMVKRAAVTVVIAAPVCPGKFVILVEGVVADVEQAMQAGLYYTGPSHVDDLLLTQVHPQVLPAVRGTTKVESLNAIGIVETFTVAATVLGADAACKAADIELVEMRLAVGLGGKAYFTMTGEQHMVEAAIAAAVEKLDGGLIIRTEIIPAPHSDMGDVVL